MRKILSYLAIVGFTFGMANLANATPIITNGLVASWEFSGDATDSSGNSFDGIVHGATLTTDRFGNVNSAYSFDGNDYIDYGNRAEYKNSSLTLSLWVNYSSLNEYQTIASFNGDRAWYTSGWHLESRSGKHGYGIGEYHPNYFIGGVGGYNQLSAGGDEIVTDNWYHIVSTFDDYLKEMNIYVDGENVGTMTAKGSILYSDIAQLTIGVQDTGTEIMRYFHGIIDDVYLYDRALSKSEVQGLYAATPVPEPTTLLLFVTSIVGLAGTRVRRKKK